MSIHAGPADWWTDGTNAGRTHIATKGIVTNGLVLNLDAGVSSSYSGTGDTWVNLSGSGTNATLVNGLPFVTDNGGALSFAATNDYITANTGITGTSYTFLLWYKNTATAFATTGHRTFMASNNFRFQWDDNSSTTARGPFIDFTSALGGGQAKNSDSLTPSNWFGKYQMVGVVSNGTTVRTIWNETVGGVATISASRAFSSTGNVVIGYDNLSGIGGADAINVDGGTVTIPIVLIYNTALTNDQILKNYNTLRRRFDV